MNRWLFAALALVPAAYAQTTHDDPIIIDESSVNITFGEQTKALLASNMWGEFDPNVKRYLYYQHTHMPGGGRTRKVLSFFRSQTGGPLTLQAAKQSDNDIDEQKLRIEIHIKGIPNGRTAYEPLPNGPQLILYATQKSVPCCAHPGTTPIGPGDACVPHRESPVDHKQFPWSWVVSSDQKLDPTPVRFQPAASKRRLVRYQYKNPGYKEVKIDHWTVKSDRNPTPLFSSIDPATKKNRVAGCPVIEVCASEKAKNNAFCETTPFQCVSRANQVEINPNLKQIK